MAFPSLKKPPQIVEMAANGNLIFQDTNKATFVGANSNVVIDTVNASFGVGVDVNGPTSNLHVIGNCFVSTDFTASTLSGNGSGLTALDAANITTGTLDRNTTGSAATLTTPRTIGGVNFDGSVDIVPTTFGAATFDTDTLVVDSVNDRVGVGTNAPENALHIRNGIPAVLLDDSDDDTKVRIAGGVGGDLYVDSNWGGSGNTGDIIFREASSEKMRITGTGNVGIGTTSPQQKLEVHGNILLGANDVSSFIHSGADIAMSSDTDVLIVSDANDVTGGASGDIIFGAGSAINMDTSRNFTYDQAYPSGLPRLEHMRIKASGNVGIGTTVPSTDLQIGNTSTKTSDTYLTIASDGGNAYAQGIRLIHHGTDTSSMYGWRIRGDDTDDCFHINRINSGSQQASALTIKSDGNVGIGTDIPRNKLEIKTTGSDSGLLHLFKTTGNGVGIDFCDQNSFLQKGYLRYHHQDSQALGAGNCFRFSSTEASETLACGGSLLIGVDGKDTGYMTNSTGSGRKNLFIQSTFGNNTSQNYGWWMGAQNQALSTADNDFYFSVVRNGVIKLCGTMLDQNNAQLNFTGQHRTFVKDTPTNQLVDKEGLIVSADQNEFIKMSGGVAYGKDAITINESLPLVSLSTKSNDKKCFGVLSTTEDPDTRKEVHGNFASTMRKEEGDTRVYVNSVGEGAIWVANTNGTLESGDYITTSNVTGYGMKQDDDILHNYTVAKILMDCDFNPVTQPKRTIRKESRMIDYWIRYGDVKVTEEEYHTLPETKRKIVEDVHYRIDQMEVVKENPEKDTFVYEQREEMVNVLDEHGEFQWEETGETEKAYKIRYLDADGNITDEANAVHKAAFVGCTYHCG